MQQVRFDGSFNDWRKAARTLLHDGVAPHELEWLVGNEPGGLFDRPDVAASGEERTRAPRRPLRIPRQLLEELVSAARFRTADRWSLLYRILWRIAQGDHAAGLAGDLDGSELQRRIKAVRREAHHLHAFLRFRPCSPAADGPQFAAWFEPAHDVLPSAAEHFVERMGTHRWLIATPDDAVYCDGANLQYSKPCPPQWQRLAQQTEDKGEELWLAYYGSTFNPARLNRDGLENNLPVRFWKNLTEGVLIPKMMSQARAGAQRDGQAEAVASKVGKRIAHRQGPKV